MNESRFSGHRAWPQKFADAARGMWWSIRGGSSFRVHLFCAAAALATAWVLGLSRDGWCLVLLCITLVISAEIFNSALEAMARSIDTSHNPDLKNALDAGSGAVLFAALGAVSIGTLLFGHRLGELLHWWP